MDNGFPRLAGSEWAAMSDVFDAMTVDGVVVSDPGDHGWVYRSALTSDGEIDQDPEDFDRGADFYTGSDLVTSADADDAYRGDVDPWDGGDQWSGPDLVTSSDPDYFDF